MTTDTLALVAEFHRVFEHPAPSHPTLDNEPLNRLRVALLQEELDELRAGLEAKDPVQVLDALSDLQYVLDGAYLALGLSPLKNPAFEEVHRSNMSKLGHDGKPIRRADGKVLKGPNYSPPDLAKLLPTP